MDAVKFLEVRDKMCETYPACVGCALVPVCESDKPDYNKMVAAVEAWDREHPTITWMIYLHNLYDNDYATTLSFWDWLSTMPIPEQLNGNNN